MSLPIKKFVYVADTAYLPYGEKTTEFLIERAKKITLYFKNLGINTIIIACHTSAATSFESLKKEFPEINFIDPLPMTTDNAVKLTKNNRIAIMATERSINTGVHKKLVLKRNLNVTVIEQSCPLFVPLIENNGSEQKIIEAVSFYAEKIINLKADTLILGCTHYPFISQYITQHIPKIKIVSAASAIKHLLDTKDIQSIKNQKIEYVVSGEIEKIKPLISKYMSKKNGLSLSFHQLEKPYL